MGERVVLHIIKLSIVAAFVAASLINDARTEAAAKPAACQQIASFDVRAG